MVDYKNGEATDTDERHICVSLICKDDNEADMFISYILGAIGKGLY